MSLPQPKWSWTVGEVESMEHWPILCVHVRGELVEGPQQEFYPGFQICGTDKDEMLAMAEKVKNALESQS